MKLPDNMPVSFIMPTASFPLIIIASPLWMVPAAWTRGPHGQPTPHLFTPFVQMGRTALMTASQTTHSNVVKALVDAGAKLEAKDNSVSVLRQGFGPGA